MTVPFSGTPFAFEAVAVSTTAIGLTATAFENVGDSKVNAKYAFVTVADNPIRVRQDGTAPIATIGHAFAAATSFYLFGKSAMKKFKAIRTGASDAILSVTYFA